MRSMMPAQAQTQETDQIAQCLIAVIDNQRPRKPSGLQRWRRIDPYPRITAQVGQHQSEGGVVIGEPPGLPRPHIGRPDRRERQRRPARVEGQAAASIERDRSRHGVAIHRHAALGHRNPHDIAILLHIEARADVADPHPTRIDGQRARRVVADVEHRAARNLDMIAATPPDQQAAVRREQDRRSVRQGDAADCAVRDIAGRWRGGEKRNRDHGGERCRDRQPAPRPAAAPS